MKPGSNHHCQKHCWHFFYGPGINLVPDGHVVEKCCQCPATQTVPVTEATNSPHSEGGDV